MSTRHRPYLFLTIIFGILIMGCSHNLRVTNQEDYFAPPSPPLKNPLKLEITSNSDAHIQNSKYVRSIVDSLQRTSSFEKVIYPYNQSIHRDQIDVVVDIAVNPKYSGSGYNFFVNFPGFIIFAPAIWGYGYNAEIETLANITWLKDGRSQQITIPAKYTFRQAEIDRTWTEISWLEVGAIAFIGGLVFTQYDPDVTDEFISKVSPNYGTYIGKKLWKDCRIGPEATG